MTGLRNRDLFGLYRVDVRTNLAKPRTLLVWAHRASDAVRAAEELVEADPGNRFVMDVLGVTKIHSPDTDTEDFAKVAWDGGDLPVWPDAP